MASLSPPMLYEIFSKGPYSDFTIICNDQSFRVHKVIICAESPFFKEVCTGYSRERSSVELKEVDPEVVARVIHYLYLGDYHTNPDMCTLEIHSDPQHAATTTWIKSLQSNRRVRISKQGRTPDDDELSMNVKNNLKIHADTYCCADKLGITSLKQLAAALFVNAIKDQTSERVFTEAIRLVYQNSTTPDCILRSTITDFCLFNHHTIKGLPQARKLMEEYEPAAWRVACNVAEAYTDRLEEGIEHTYIKTSDHGEQRPPESNAGLVDSVTVVQDCGKTKYNVKASCPGEGCHGKINVEIIL